MADEDIYGNKKAYENFMANLSSLTILQQPHRGKRKYYCKNPANLEYFRKLHMLFERKDSSYIRRLRLFRTLLIVTTITEKNIALLEREDIDAIVTFSHSVNKIPKTKYDFVRDMKFMWKNLFPEKEIKKACRAQGNKPYFVHNPRRKGKAAKKKTPKLLKKVRVCVEQMNGFLKEHVLKYCWTKVKGFAAKATFVLLSVLATQALALYNIKKFGYPSIRISEVRC